MPSKRSDFTPGIDLVAQPGTGPLRARRPSYVDPYNELRYRGLADADPRAAEALLAQAEQVVVEKYRQYEELASRPGESFHPAAAHRGAAAGAHA